MTEKEFIHWLQGYLEGVSHDAQKPSLITQTILDKIKSINPKKYSGYTSTTTTDNFTYPKDKQIITG